MSGKQVLNKPTFPRFTAEASLADMEEYYRTVTSYDLENVPMIMPRIMWPIEPRCFYVCIRTLDGISCKEVCGPPELLT
jgi:hypothetical protein